VSDLSTPIIFKNSEHGGQPTPNKLNLAFAGAVIQPAFFSAKPSVSSPGTGDQLLLLRSDNTYARVPASSMSGGGGVGDMTKAVYDTNNDGIVDHAALANTAPWSGITGKPSTFPPDATAMLKSVYDTNGDGISDHAALADTAPWTGITGKPATFPPNITIDPGTWTTPSFGTGWSDGGSCAYRVQTIGAVQTVFARGIALQTAAAASLAFTLPTGARPAAARVCTVSGYQNESDATQSLVLYGVTVATSGAVNIYPIIKNNAVWTSTAQSQSVYLDSLVFSL
jgi:hypothetical protein